MPDTIKEDDILAVFHRDDGDIVCTLDVRPERARELVFAMLTNAVRLLAELDGVYIGLKRE